VGTNDVLSSLDPKLARLSRKFKNIPHEPAPLHFRNNIIRIVQQLKEETGSKIAVASLPVLGENLYSVENKTIALYNAELRKITEDEDVVYLPVHEKQKDFLIKEIEGRGKDCLNSSRKSFTSLLLHYLLFMDLDTISRRNGYLLLTDGIHQNSAGAKVIADEIEDFIRSG
jgi:lysophospholipase L1-like esterase